MENILYCYGSALVPRKLVRRKLKNLGKICTTTTYTDGKGKRRFKGHKKNLKASQEYPKAFGMEATWFYFIWSLYGDYNFMQLYIISM